MDIKKIKFKKPKLDFKISKSPKKRLYIKFISDLKIRTKLIISFLFILTLPLTIVVIFFYTNSLNTVENKVKMVTDELSSQANTAINMQIQEIENISSQVFSNKSIYSNLAEGKDENQYDKYQKRTAATNALNSYTLSSDIIESIFILLNDENTYVNTGKNRDLDYLQNEFKNSEIYKEYKEKKGVYWLSGLNNDYNALYLIRNLSNITYGTDIGVFLIGTPTETFTDIIKNVNLGQNSSFYVIDNKGKILISPDAEKLGQDEDIQLVEQINSHVSQDLTNSSFILGNNLISFGVCSNGWITVAKIPTVSLTSEIKTVGQVAVIVSIVCVIIAMLLSMIIANGIANPIKRIMKLMKSAEIGDLTIKSNDYGKSEIGQLSESFNNMISNINELVKDSYNIANQVYSDTQVVNSVALQTSNISKQISLAIESISKGNSEQAESANHTNDIIHQLTENINKEEEVLTSFSDTIINTKTVGNSAMAIVEELNKRSEQTLKMFNTINNNIKELNKNSEQIIKMTKLIDDIAEQTNLLSLNARIEAARAGEAGRGFTVVADEVGKLAIESKEATKLITDITNSIQKDTLSTVEVVEKGTSTFKSQLEAVKDTNSAFTEIDEALDKISSQIKTLTDVMTDISNMKDTVTQAVENIADISQQTASAAEEVLATGEEQSESSGKLSKLAEHLAKIAETLKEKITYFKI